MGTFQDRLWNYEKIIYGTHVLLHVRLSKHATKDTTNRTSLRYLKVEHDMDSLHKKKTNLKSNVTYPTTMNLNRDISRFVVLWYVTSIIRLVFYKMEGVYTNCYFSYSYVRFSLYVFYVHKKTLINWTVFVTISTNRYGSKIISADPTR